MSFFAQGAKLMGQNIYPDFHPTADRILNGSDMELPIWSCNGSCLGSCWSGVDSGCSGILIGSTGSDPVDPGSDPAKAGSGSWCSVRSGIVRQPLYDPILLNTDPFPIGSCWSQIDRKWRGFISISRWFGQERWPIMVFCVFFAFLNNRGWWIVVIGYVWEGH